MAGKKSSKKSKSSSGAAKARGTAKTSGAGRDRKARPAPSPKEPKVPELDEQLDAEAEAHALPAGADMVDELLGRLPYRQQVFVAEYMANSGNGTRAAIVAGYSKATADSQASRLLKDVKVAACIDAWTASVLSRKKVTAEGVIDELRKIAYRRPQKLFREDGSLIPIPELDDETAAAIESIEVKEITREGCVVGHLKKIKLSSKVNALEMLGKYYKLFTDKVEHSGMLGVQLIHDVPRPERKK